MKNIKRSIALVLTMTMTFAFAFSCNSFTAKAAENDGPLVYQMGDSILDGAGSGRVGPAELLQTKHGYKVAYDGAISGAPLTNLQTNAVVNQYTQLAAAVAKNGYNSSTIVILDGGTNDVSDMCKSIDRVGYSKISIYGSTDTYDICYQTDVVLNSLCNLFGNTENNPNNVKIYFVIPNMDWKDYKHNENWNNNTFTYLAKQTEVVQKYASRGVVCVKSSEVLDSSSDYHQNSVHPNYYGEIKLTDYILSH